MATTDRLRDLGLFDARVPRYTSYPPANHFSGGVDGDVTAGWLRAIEPGTRVSLYLHIPYCRRLCWFCACRTQGTTTDRPLVPYLAQLKAELNLVNRYLPKDVVLSQIHLGGGTPTILSPEMLTDLGTELAMFRPWARDMEFSVEIDPTEVNQERIDALRVAGMTRASIGVQDFDPKVQEAIGRIQSFDRTREVVEMLRAAGIDSLNMDVLFGLPYQTKARMTESVQRVLSLTPDRVALYGYAHVPWMAKRQVMIPTEELPDAETRLNLFETARRLFLWDGYREIGIDHYARPTDRMAQAEADGTLRRNFQGYTVDPSDVLIGLGASAISRYPQGFAQNHSTSSKYAKDIEAGRLATHRGHILTEEDHLRSALIEDMMCRFEIDLDAVAERFGVSVARLQKISRALTVKFAEQIEIEGNRIRLTDSARLLARLVAHEIDAYAMPEGRHSRAL